MTTATKWNLTGTYFESCDCEIACPCIFLRPPNTENGDCNVLITWNIENGSFGDTDVSGLKVAMAAHAPGLMIDGNWKVALYLDENASESQQAALGQIFGGQAGGVFEIFAGFISEILGVGTASIEYSADGKNRSVKVGNIAEAAIEGIEGLDGADVTISGNPLGVSLGVPAVVATSTVNKFNDHGMTWDFSGKNGYYSDFSYEV